MSIRRVALLTAGGFAPCLSAAVGDLIERYIVIDEEGRKNAGILREFGGSPIGNSRVKLTNAKNLVERGLVAEGVNPLEFAAEQLRKDGVDVLHTIGGDDTNTTAADLAAYLHEHDYELTVVGLPKTIDNDIIPIRQSLGAWSAAEEGAGFAFNVIGEHRSNPRMLIIHECMGRNCGYLTAETAKRYHELLDTKKWAPSLGLTRERWDVHAVFLPEMKLDFAAEAERLKAIMDEQGNVNIFLSEGAGVPEIIAEMEARGEEVQRDPFGHVKLDTINPGQWFAKRFASLIGAEKVMVQKSGYYSRATNANAEDLDLIKSMCDLAVECALRGESGVIGQDEENGDRLSAIAFPRIAGAKPFDITQSWFTELMAELGQKVDPAETAPEH